MPKRTPHRHGPHGPVQRAAGGSASRQGALHHPASSAYPDQVRIRNGRTYRPGWRGVIEQTCLASVHDLRSRTASWTPQAVESAISQLIPAGAHGEKVLLFGSLTQLHGIASFLLDGGRTITLAPGSLLGTRRRHERGAAAKDPAADAARTSGAPSGSRTASRCPSATSTGWPRPTGRRCSAPTAATTSRPGYTRSPSTTRRRSRDETRSTGLLAFFDPYGGGDLFPAFFRTADRVTLVRGTACPCGEPGQLPGGGVDPAHRPLGDRMRGPGVNAAPARRPGQRRGRRAARAPRRAERRGAARARRHRSRLAPALLAAGGAARAPHHRPTRAGRRSASPGARMRHGVRADDGRSGGRPLAPLHRRRVGGTRVRVAGRPREGPARTGVLGAPAGGAGRGRPAAWPTRPTPITRPSSRPCRPTPATPRHDGRHSRRPRPVGPRQDGRRPPLPARQGLQRPVAQDARSAGRVRFFPSKPLDKVAGWVPVAWEMPLYRADIRPRTVVGYATGTSRAAPS